MSLKDELSKEEAKEYCDLYMKVAEDCKKNDKRHPFQLSFTKRALEGLRKIVNERKL